MAGSEAAWQQAAIRLRGRVAAGCDATVAIRTRAAAAREPSLMVADGMLTAALPMAWISLQNVSFTRPQSLTLDTEA